MEPYEVRRVEKHEKETVGGVGGERLGLAHAVVLFEPRLQQFDRVQTI